MSSRWQALGKSGPRASSKHMSKTGSKMLVAGIAGAGDILGWTSNSQVVNASETTLKLAR